MAVRTHSCTTLYKAIVVPHLDYCSSVWDPPHTTYVRKLERVQSFAAHVVTGDWASSSSKLLATIKWPSLASRRLRRKLWLCHRILSSNSLIDPSFFPTANRRCATHKNSAPLYRPFVRTLHHKHLFRWSIVDQWNKLPEYVASLHSSRAFNRHLNQPFNPPI